MSIYYKLVCFYGITFTYDELKHISKGELYECAKKKNCELPYGLVDVWSEYGYPIIAPYYDAESEDCLFGFGEQFKGREQEWCKSKGIEDNIYNFQKWLRNISEYMIRSKIKKFCDEYNLPYKIPRIIIMPTIE